MENEVLPSSWTFIVSFFVRHLKIDECDHGVFKPPIGHGLICSQETKSIAMLYDTHRF